MKHRYEAWARAATAFSRRVRGYLADRAGLVRLARGAALLALVVALGTASVTARRRLVREGRAQETGAAAVAGAVRPAEAPAAPSPEPEEPRWMWPVEGEILGAYAPEELAWSQTLGQWQTHPALDIAAAPGEAVYACADGTVLDAYSDRLWGNVIVIDHGDGWRSTYANLNTLNLVRPGEAVVKGDVISAVGRSAACESDMDWHLHFMLERDGAPADFAALTEPGATPR